VRWKKIPSAGGGMDKIEDMMETDHKQIVREWNREIEAEIRREAGRDDGPWKIIVWVALEVLWLVALFAVLGLFQQLR
jgi:hypothetical protein